MDPRPSDSDPRRPASLAGSPLTPFEHLMLVDARPGHPMCFFLECIVAGDLDEQRLRRAVVHAAEPHERFRSRVFWHAGRPCWGEPDVTPSFVSRLDAAGEDPWRPIDLEHESGLRVVVRSLGSRRFGIVLVVHHAVCDGIAACEYFGDLWDSYHGLAPPRFSAPVERTRPEAQRPTAGAAGDAGPSLLSQEEWQPQVNVLGEAVAFARFRPAVLAREHARPGHAGELPGEPPYATLEIEEQSLVRLRAAATSRGATLNDLILAAVMRAVVAWNRERGRCRRGVRVTMPVSTRLPRDRSPARNSISYAFLDRSRESCADRESLLASLAEVNRWILSSGVVQGFLEAIGFLARWPWLLKAVTRLPLCLSTVIVSNIGDVSRRMRAGVPKIGGRDAPGDLVVQGFRGVPPARPRTNGSLGVLTYGGATTICCLCTAGPSREAAAAFLAVVRDELDQWS